MPAGLTAKGCTPNYSDFWRLLSVLKMQRYLTSILAVLKMYIQHTLMNRYRLIFLLLAVPMYLKRLYFNTSLPTPVLYLLRIKYSMIYFSGISGTAG